MQRELAAAVPVAELHHRHHVQTGPGRLLQPPAAGQPRQRVHPVTHEPVNLTGQMHHRELGVHVHPGLQSGPHQTRHQRVRVNDRGQRRLPGQHRAAPDRGRHRERPAVDQHVPVNIRTGRIHPRHPPQRASRVIVLRLVADHEPGHRQPLGHRIHDQVREVGARQMLPAPIRLTGVRGALRQRGVAGDVAAQQFEPHTVGVQPPGQSVEPLLGGRRNQRGPLPDRII